MLQLHVLLAIISADIQELGALMLFRASKKSAMPDPSSLTPRAELANARLAGTFALRTEKVVRKVVCWRHLS